MGNFKKRKNNKRNKQKNKHLNNQDTSKPNEKDYPSQDETTTEKVSKRAHLDSDSDHEEQPKRKKKKRTVVADSTDSKGKKSIRQMKREKHQQRLVEAVSVAKDKLKSDCINYLLQWKHNKANWKFMKIKQVWLSKNKFNSLLVPDTHWSLLLDYFDSAQGNIKKTLLDDANKVIQEMDEWNETPQQRENDGITADSSTDNAKTKPDESVYNRARDLIQRLHE